MPGFVLQVHERGTLVTCNVPKQRNGMLKLFAMFLFCCGPAAVLGQESASEIEKLQKQLSIQQRQLEEVKSALEQVKAEAIRSQSSGKTEKRSPDLHPLFFRIGGAEFTPGGFLDLSTVWRSTNGGSGVATSFGSIPANNTSAGRLSEWRFSTYNSRITLKVTERPTENENLLATGYLETDFAGSMPSTAYVTSNSNSFRLRQAWGSIQIGKFEILGGQAWTLMTPNREGTSPVPSTIFLGLGQDSSYLAGLVWVRQSQIRATYHPTSHWTAAFSVENPQQYVTSATTLPSDFSAQFDNSSGNSTIPNARPDLIAKVAFDAKPAGRTVHIEFAGLSRQFRTLTANYVRKSSQGWGGSMNLIVEPVKNFRWILTSFFSGGGGRYIMGMGPDVVVRPDGSMSTIHSTSGITGFEYQFTRESQAFAYYSGAYFSRNYSVISPGNYIGFGYPGSSNLANRQIQEVTTGYLRTFWKNPNYGSFLAVGQYSYVTRAPWYVAPGSNPDMHTHMVFAGMRFTLP
jgi:hypothetical protein